MYKKLLYVIAGKYRMRPSDVTDLLISLIQRKYYFETAVSGLNANSKLLYSFQNDLVSAFNNESKSEGREVRKALCSVGKRLSSQLKPVKGAVWDDFVNMSLTHMGGSMSLLESKALELNTTSADLISEAFLDVSHSIDNSEVDDVDWSSIPNILSDKLGDELSYTLVGEIAAFYDATQSDQAFADWLDDYTNEMNPKTVGVAKALFKAFKTSLNDDCFPEWPLYALRTQ